MIIKLKKSTINNKPKKMNVDSDLHIEINKLQSEILEKYRIKINIQDLTNECIAQGIPIAKECIIKQLRKELIISPVD